MCRYRLHSIRNVFSSFPAEPLSIGYTIRWWCCRAKSIKPTTRRTPIGKSLLGKNRIRNIKTNYIENCVLKYLSTICTWHFFLGVRCKCKCFSPLSECREDKLLHGYILKLNVSFLQCPHEADDKKPTIWWLWQLSMHLEELAGGNGRLHTCLR